MHDTLQYFHRDPPHRRHHLQELTFRSVYQGSESFVLPLSHDEVVHGKGSLLASMPGARREQLANLRLLLGYQWAIPGKKLLFMGGEFGQPEEWRHEAELDWGLLTDPAHRGILDLVTELNGLYRSEPALHMKDCGDDGLQWIVGDDAVNAVFAFLRVADGHRPVLVAANFTPVPHESYRLGVPVPGPWTPLLESDATRFGGSGTVNVGMATHAEPSHGYPQSVEIGLGPLSVSFFAPSDGHH
jgi:1,4-alpha-glucan branching enzyme